MYQIYGSNVCDYTTMLPIFTELMPCLRTTKMTPSSPSEMTSSSSSEMSSPTSLEKGKKKEKKNKPTDDTGGAAAAGGEGEGPATFSHNVLLSAGRFANTEEYVQRSLLASSLGK